LKERDELRQRVDQFEKGMISNNSMPRIIKNNGFDEMTNSDGAAGL
jgi:hypothetical protein